ncbi:hypothetical protein [Eubacterium sp.]|uniref:hypothetical protein n=1 Tax=Eubacterium sp. TaxID=142586 RepID=UPI0025D18910|nr:hypothetical protein [Eubacterium sp.]MCR5629886.1 hypothetical protein [Eubacterium sp.]
MKLVKKLGIIITSVALCVGSVGVVSADEVKIPAKLETPHYSSTYDGGSVLLEWEPDLSIDGYEIEYAYASGKKTTVKDIKDDCYCEIPCRKNFYRARVRAYVKDDNGNKTYGEWSDYGYFAKDLSHQDVETDGYVVNKKNKVKVTWNIIKGAVKYEVYMSTAYKTGFKKVKTVKKNKNTFTITKFRKKKIKRGRTYYVRVCAVTKVGKRVIKTPMTESVEAYISVH